MRFLIGLAAASAALAACSIDHRSQEFACGPDNACTGSLAGRVCVDGFCVEPGGTDAAIADTNPDSNNPPDAGSGSGSGSCPMECTSCQGTTCTIDCSQTSECMQPITCPTGYDCNVECDTGESCRGGIDCTNSTSCTITCSGANTCHEITCGAGSCSVACTGSNSCHGVDCNDSCACDVDCIATDQTTCENITCETGQDGTCTLGEGCTSQLPGCDTCM